MRKPFIYSLLLVWLASMQCAVAQNENQAPNRRRNFFDEHNPGVHDPVMAYENGRYYVFATGMRVSVMSSADLKTWQMERPVLSETPQWAVDSIPTYRGHTWAPDVIKGEDGMWHLYYSCSGFGKNRSAIGEAVTKTLDPSSPDFGWVDKGMVVESVPGKTNFNAIDANVIIDGKGTPWLSFGSFWGGIQQVKLKPDMHTPASKKFKTIATRRYKKKANDPYPQSRDNSIEAPFIIHHGDYYYLFVSFDYCCRGLNSNYKTVVGRSKKVTGPYIDKSGRRMDQGGGTLLYDSDDDFVAVGHNAAYSKKQMGVPGATENDWLFLAHGYDRNNRGASKIVLRPMTFDSEGWPVIQK